jgi:hypothetical protein
MKLRSLHRIHRWIAVWTGVFIAGWIITGVVPMLPGSAPRPRPPQALDLAEVAVTPSEAAGVLAGAGAALAVTSLRLTQLGDVLAYEIAVAGRRQFVDARTGRPITVDAGLARTIATAQAPAGAQVVRMDLVSRRREDLMYMWGTLPAHRLTFDDPWVTVVYVGVDGFVRSTTRWSRVMDIVSSFHTFNPLDLVVGDPAIRKGILIAVSLVALLTALTGYAIVAWRQRGA